MTATGSPPPPAQGGPAPGGVSHRVTVAHLRDLATVDRSSLLSGADTLIDSDQGVIRVPFRVVEAVLDGRSRLADCRVLYTRGQFADDGIVTGKHPKTTDGTSIDERLAGIAEFLSEPAAAAARCSPASG